MHKFSSHLIAWQQLHGRHDLPWQTKLNHARDPYAVWVSEIMLQQTQVAAVIGYYGNFMQRFPTIAALAAASQEDVLQSWSGLGYYSRARNLHAAARKIVDDSGGQGVDIKFPTSFDDILSLPGIGRSTAAAISTFALNAPQPILDGNVKRVFARYFNIAGATNTPKVIEKMWQIAERENPINPQDAIIYTQGLMDLGATVCTRGRPRCPECRMNTGCQAYANNEVHLLPTPKPKKTTPQKQTMMLILLRAGAEFSEVLLEKRPQTGIWAGLWSLPEIDVTEIATEVAFNKFGMTTEAEETLPIINHAFTHFKLAIHPQPLQVISQKNQVISQKNQVIKQKNLVNQSNTIWLPINEAMAAAIPTPVRNILSALKAH
jgi:A/G-specific adenine glycosylase